MTERNVFESQWFLGNELNLNYPDEKEGFTKLFELINHFQETSQVNSQTMVALKLAGLLQEALYRLAHADDDKVWWFDKQDCKDAVHHMDATDEELEKLFDEAGDFEFSETAEWLCELMEEIQS